MTELVFLKHKQALTTSLKVAEIFEKPHKDILEKIRFLAAEISATKLEDGYNPQFRESSYVDERGKTYPLFVMNRDGFTELVGNLNGKKAREWKRKYFAAFNAMEAALAERKSAEWQEIRSATKDGYKELSAAVHDLYEFAKAHGCNVSEKKFYINFAKLLNKTLGIAPGTRDDLATWQLYEVEKLQFIARTIIAGLLAAGVDYHQPYQKCKAAFNAYAQLSYINERLLLAQRGSSD